MGPGRGRMWKPHVLINFSVNLKVVFLKRPIHFFKATQKVPFTPLTAALSHTTSCYTTGVSGLPPPAHTEPILCAQVGCTLSEGQGWDTCHYRPPVLRTTPGSQKRSKLSAEYTSLCLCPPGHDRQAGHEQVETEHQDTPSPRGAQAGSPGRSP